MAWEQKKSLLVLDLVFSRYFKKKKTFHRQLLKPEEYYLATYILLYNIYFKCYLHFTWFLDEQKQLDPLEAT